MAEDAPVSQFGRGDLGEVGVLPRVNVLRRGMPLHKKGPESVGKILSQLKKDTELGKQLEQAQIWERWPELAGERYSAHGRPERIKEATLHIEVDSAVWMHRFAFVKWDIIKRVNRLAGCELISDIFISFASDDSGLPPQDDV